MVKRGPKVDLSVVEIYKYTNDEACRLFFPKGVEGLHIFPGDKIYYVFHERILLMHATESIYPNYVVRDYKKLSADRYTVGIPKELVIRLNSKTATFQARGFSLAMFF